MRVLQASKYTINPDTDCWEWNGFRLPAGYGQVMVGSKKDNSRTTTTAHRLAYQEAYGDLSSELHVMHICDNPCCVNPKHLRQGTAQDNMTDKVNKDRHHRTDKTIYTFVHYEHGVFVGRRTSFQKQYNLSSSNLARTIRGEFKHIKGWRLLNATTESKQHSRSNERFVHRTSSSTDNNPTGA